MSKKVVANVLVSLGLLLWASFGVAQQTSIELWHIQSTGAGPEMIQQAVDRYMADNPDVTVQAVPMQNDPYKTRIRTAIGAGDGPCIFISWGGGPLLEYVNAGQVVDLTEYMQQDNYVDRFMPAALTNITFNDRIYGVPVENTSVAGFWYNKDIFDELGLTPPTTYEELLSVIETLKANNVVPFALANKTMWTSSMYYMYLVDRIGGPETFANAANRTGGSFEDEPFVRAGEMIQDLVRMDAFNRGFNGLDYDTGQSRLLLYSGNAAMELMGSWQIQNVLAENPDFNMGFFPFPAVEGGEGDPRNVVGTVGNNFYHISSSCEYPDEAFELLTYLIDEESVEFRVNAGRIPPIRGIAERIEDPLMQEVLQMVEAAPSVQLWYDQYLPPQLGEVHKNTMQALFGLEITPEEAARRHEQAAAEFYGE
jgi:raffinose/stachyose/melibiose transport system substrate-binding protein